MPYIKRTRRLEIVEPLLHAVDNIETPGELNYAMTVLAINFLKKKTMGHYAHRSLVLAQFEAAKLEFYRRMLAPYEDKKIAENGDVYPKEDR